MRPAPLIIAATLLITGCGYHTAGSATHVPASVRTVAVPAFTTRVQNFRTETLFTAAVVRELDTRTRLRVEPTVTPATDATLTGTILSETVTPLTYDSTSGQTSSYLLSITAKVILTSHSGRVLYENDAISYREQYQSTTDLSNFIQEDTAATQRIARDFAHTVVSDMLESF